MSTTEITVSAAQYADHDDCLAAAARDYVREHKLSGWDLAPRWADEDNRDEIILCVPTSSVKITAETITDEQIHALESESEQAGDRSMARDCRDALALLRQRRQGMTEWGTSVPREISACVDAINAARAMED